MQAHARSKAGGETPDLTYNVATCVLKGSIDGTAILGFAGAGGHAGSQTPGRVDWWLANNPLAFHVKEADDGSRPGGPLPMGLYHLLPHESKPHYIRLRPFDVRQLLGRDNMEIHGRGPKGSAGCIVPYDKADLFRLCDLVHAREKQHRPHVVLKVFAEGADLDRQNRTA